MSAYLVVYIDDVNQLCRESFYDRPSAEGFTNDIGNAGYEWFLITACDDGGLNVEDGSDP